MHETPLVRNLMRKVEAVAAKQNASRVTGVILVLGALAPYTPESLRWQFAHAAHGTIAEGAAVQIKVGTDPTHKYAQDVLLESLEISVTTRADEPLGEALSARR